MELKELKLSIGSNGGPMICVAPEVAGHPDVIHVDFWVIIF